MTLSKLVYKAQVKYTEHQEGIEVKRHLGSDNWFSAPIAFVD
jgi:hypothetical protein